MGLLGFGQPQDQEDGDSLDVQPLPCQPLETGLPGFQNVGELRFLFDEEQPNDVDGESDEQIQGEEQDSIETPSKEPMTCDVIAFRQLGAEDSQQHGDQDNHQPMKGLIDPWRETCRLLGCTEHPGKDAADPRKDPLYQTDQRTHCFFTTG